MLDPLDQLVFIRVNPAFVSPASAEIARRMRGADVLSHADR